MGTIRYKFVNIKGLSHNAVFVSVGIRSGIFPEWGDPNIDPYIL